MYPRCSISTCIPLVWRTPSGIRPTSGPDALCSPGDQVVTGGPEAALVAIITNIIVLLVGIALWIQAGWKWLALGSGAMLISAGAFAGSYWSLPIANFGEIFITASLIASALRFRAT